MNRRTILKWLGLTPFVGVAAAESPRELSETGFGLAKPKAEGSTNELVYEDKYWEAQRQIDELCEERRILRNWSGGIELQKTTYLMP